MKFDPTKPVQTRDGRPARIICTDRKGDYPIVALVVESDSFETSRTYDENGCYDSKQSSKLDLINVPEKIVRYVNVYPVGVSYSHKSREEANNAVADKHYRIACIRVVFEEGQFDD